MYNSLKSNLNEGHTIFVALISFLLFGSLQILKTGFFHADPHPGNLAIDKDEAIIYYDFGMMGEIKTFTRERLLDLFYAVYEKDATKVLLCILLLFFNRFWQLATVHTVSEADRAWEYMIW